MFPCTMGLSRMYVCMWNSSFGCKTKILNLWCYKLQNETQVINKYGKQNQNIFSVIVMKELLCFGFSKFSLSVWCELNDQTQVLYIDILPSRMHLVVITTNEYSLPSIRNHSNIWIFNSKIDRALDLPKVQTNFNKIITLLSMHNINRSWHERLCVVCRLLNSPTCPVLDGLGQVWVCRNPIFLVCHVMFFFFASLNELVSYDEAYAWPSFMSWKWGKFYSINFRFPFQIISSRSMQHLHTQLFL